MRANSATPWLVLVTYMLCATTTSASTLEMENALENLWAKAQKVSKQYGLEPSAEMKLFVEPLEDFDDLSIEAAAEILVLSLTGQIGLQLNCLDRGGSLRAADDPDLKPEAQVENLLTRIRKLLVRTRAILVEMRHADDSTPLLDFAEAELHHFDEDVGFACTELSEAVSGWVTTYIENDSILQGEDETDRYYTNALRFHARFRVSERFRKHKLGLPEASSMYWGLFFGQHMYTPTNYNTTDLDSILADRPYAGFFYFGGSLDMAWQHTAKLSWGNIPRAATAWAEFTVGRTGPKSYAGDVQRHWHALLRDLNDSPTPRDPIGWDVPGAQVPQGAKVILQVGGSSEVLAYESARSGLGFALAGSGNGAIGNLFDSVEGAAELRMGWLGADRSDRGISIKDKVSRTARPARWALYLHASYGGRLSLKNETVDYNPDGYEQYDGRRKNWVSDRIVGAVARLSHVQLGFGWLWRSDEVNRSIDAPSGHQVTLLQFAWVH